MIGVNNGKGVFIRTGPASNIYEMTGAKYKCNVTRHGEFFNREYAESPFVPRREFKEIEHLICRAVGFWQSRH
eukprot:1591363-Prymnesium_polylepis.1